MIKSRDKKEGKRERNVRDGGLKIGVMSDRKEGHTAEKVPAWTRPAAGRLSTSGPGSRSLVKNEHRDRNCLKLCVHNSVFYGFAKRNLDLADPRAVWNSSAVAVCQVHVSKRAGTHPGCKARGLIGVTTSQKNQPKQENKARSL